MVKKQRWIREEVKKKLSEETKQQIEQYLQELNQTEKMPISFQPLWSRETKRTRSIWKHATRSVLSTIFQQDPFSKTNLKPIRMKKIGKK